MPVRRPIPITSGRNDGPVGGTRLRAPEADLRGLGGPIARVGKPFDWEELLDRLAGVLGGPAAAQTGPRRRASDATASARAG